MTASADTDRAAGASGAAGSRAADLESRIDTRTARVGIIGLGYVGLPLARAFATAGLRVTGFDVDPAKVDALLEGRSYIQQIGAEWLQSVGTGEAGRFLPTTDFDRLREVDAILICVPTPLTRTREPDLSYVRSTCEEVSKHLQRGQLVVLESTTYPGTTEEVVMPILEKSGLEAGADFSVAYSPECEDPGNKSFGTSRIPKLVGGIDETSGRLATRLYECAIDRVVPVSHAKIAEAAKILENIYRAVNIALVNELKTLFDRMGIDIWEVVEAASTKPFGYQAFYPGPGLGGHCIPIDPFYLTWKAREYGLPTKFIELAGEINTRMPEYVLHRLMESLDRRGRTLHGSSGLVIGVAYKPDVDDVRESPALEILQLLLNRGARMQYHDPHVARIPKMRHYAIDLASTPLTPETLQAADFTLIITNHSAIDWQTVVDHSKLVVDTRNATRDVKQGRERIVKA